RFYGQKVDALTEPLFNFAVINTRGRFFSQTKTNLGVVQYWLQPERYLQDTVLVVEVDASSADLNALKQIELDKRFGGSSVQPLNVPVAIGDRYFLWARFNVPKFLIANLPPRFNLVASDQ